MYSAVKKEMAEYYRKMDMVGDLEFRDKEASDKYRARYYRIFKEMDDFYRENPRIPSVLLKSRVHTLMAEYCEPIIFLENPFFFELGYSQAPSWGLYTPTPASWLGKTKSRELIERHPLYAEIENRFKTLFDNKTTNLCSIYGSFDMDHHTLGYTKLFEVGVKGLIAEAKANMSVFAKTTEGYAFCAAVVESCRALITIAHKFADKAEQLLVDCTGEKSRAYLKKIVETARKIPENPPETFYEGLAMLIFTREAVSIMEHMGISQLGHVDRLLGDLYKQDLAAGRITEEEARELISIWMMPTDIKFDLEHNTWPETSTCIQLGGCDASGKAIFNDVTKMFIEEHHRNKLVNPKLNCRYSSTSPDEYLKLMGRAILDGHNNFALINDELIIDGLMESGVEESDARMYVNGGCQETMIEGFGHTEGAAIYVSILRFLDLFLRCDENAAVLTPIDKADTFEEFYEKFLAAFKDFFYMLTDQRNCRQSFFKEAISCPLFSSTQEGCIATGRDYICGGAKYNFSTVALVGFANVVDSLYSIKSLVYDQKQLTLREFIDILADNWEGHEAFQQEVIALPKYGHNDKTVDLLANKFLDDAANIVKSRKNERGGCYLPSTFVYNYNRQFAPCLRATPDGRTDYEYMATGCAPSQLKAVKDITEPIKTMQNVDFSVCGGGISVLDMMLPVSTNFNEDVFTSFMRACNKSNCVTVQPNIVSVEELIDAKANPEKHKNLIVRICGLSAYFVALTPEVQDEIIHRNFYEY